jgi:hypothetical protein
MLHPGRRTQCWQDYNPQFFLLFPTALGSISEAGRKAGGGCGVVCGKKAGWGSTGGRRAAAGPSSLHDLEHTHEIFFSQMLLLGFSIMMLLKVKRSQKKWVLPSLRETRYLMALSLLVHFGLDQ